jgi:endonuclease YncB( thermonuclease family)
MSKRDIRGKSGKQLYLNRLFIKGMLYTSSEMKEGYVKALSNYDITPTGDAAIPRRSYNMVSPGFSLSPYTYPVKFKEAANMQHYIEFTNLVEKDHFLNDTFPENYTYNLEGIKMYSRSMNAMEDLNYSGIYNEETEEFNPLEISLQGASNIIPEETVVDPIFNDTNYTDNGLTYDYTYTLLRGTPCSNTVVIYSGEHVQGIDITNIFERCQTISFPVYHSGVFVTNVSLSDYGSYFFGDVEIVVSTLDISLPSGYTFNYIEALANPNVVDGDTFKFIGDITFRLLGIDTPELVEEWGLYSKKCLELIFEKVNYDIKLYHDPNSDLTDKYGRLLVWCFVPINGQYVLVNDLLLRLGCGKIAYMYGNYIFNEDLNIAETFARDNLKKIWSETEFDPYHNYTINTVNKTFINNTKEYHVEVLKQYNTVFETYKLQNIVDFVEFKHLQYDTADTVVFIGRIISNDIVPEILYKGIIFLKCISENNNPTFILTVPENNGEGYFPTISERSSLGYNLYNDTHIILENTEDTFSVFDILGIEVVNPYNFEEVLLESIPGATIQIRSIMNEGYFPPLSIHPINNFKYSIRVELKLSYSTDITINVPEEIEYYYFYDVTCYSETFVFNFNNDIQEQSNTIESRNSVFADLINAPIDNEGRPINYHPEQQVFLPNPNTNVTYKIYFTIEEPIQKNYVFTGIDLITLEDLVEFKFNIPTIEESDSSISINIENNLNNLNTTYSEGEFIQRDSNALDSKIIFLSKYEKSNYQENYIEIKPFYENYILDSGFVKLKPGTTNYIDYTIPDNNSFLIRYTVQLVYKFMDTYLYNSESNFTQTYPRFKVGTKTAYVSNDMLTNNINIKNATRIELFNNQILLYGSNIGSNIIQGALFKNPEYFPFPFRTIELEEPIVHLHLHKGNIFVFGQYNIYLLSGGADLTELSLFKVYENLSINPANISTVKSIANNVVFFNKQIGYVIVQNKYTGLPQDLQIFKLTENISNVLIYPEVLLKQRLKINNLNIPVTINSVKAYPNIFAENNMITYVVSYTVNYTISGEQSPTTKYITIFYRYNQTFAYWSMYDFTFYDRFVSSYICEPQLYHQFLVKKNSSVYLSSFVDLVMPPTIPEMIVDLGIDDVYPIETFIDSGYLGVDPMNEKRFKDLLLEFNNIGGASLKLYCDFYIDGVSFLISNPEYYSLVYPTLPPQEIPGYFHLGTREDGDTNSYYQLDTDLLTVGDRVRVRYPIWGKGRMPSFTLSIQADSIYEFINFSVIYKEKNIERRR